MSKISVLLCERDDVRFSAYCEERGFKKSTLIARLVRDHLDSEGYAPQAPLFQNNRSIDSLLTTKTSSRSTDIKRSSSKVKV